MIISGSEQNVTNSCGIGTEERITCAAVTSNYILKASVNNDNGLLEIFFEDDYWSEPLAYVRGLQLAHILGVSSSIRLNLVNNYGSIKSGGIIQPNNKQYSED